MHLSLSFLPLYSLLPLLATATPSTPLTPQIGCTNAVNTTAAQEAAQYLGKYCRDKGPVTQTTKVSWAIGDVRAYVCNYSWDSSQPCTYDELEAAWTAIQNQCGQGMGGWWFEPDWNKAYGFDLVSVGWCTSIDMNI
ncbi:hypothetical protein QBC46DRAFT_440197 [Diplogelasinospora grovesii]|uniref:Uncharacterized protein n=1 Tax=Diplogelasinospora grovesii TaxID=303347 RepID=A0AAN6S3F1_9PEZI|nr:hypothetical protein QBC46DRAFT_440197 [Diplogelasinospora grovesii]